MKLVNLVEISEIWALPSNTSINRQYSNTSIKCQKRGKTDVFGDVCIVFASDHLCFQLY